MEIKTQIYQQAQVFISIGDLNYLSSSFPLLQMSEMDASPLLHFHLCNCM